jgi:hypothetical protein
MIIGVRYAVIFGKGDASDWISWDVELTAEEESAFKNALENDFPLDEVEELRDVIQRAYDDIELEEIDLGLEQEDEYVMECQGVLEMDADELNDLVANRDVHALEFFGLTDADDDELEEWDAYELDKLPLIEEFVEDFTPSSPFDTAWTLKVEFLDADEYDIE